MAMKIFLNIIEKCDIKVCKNHRKYQNFFIEFQNLLKFKNFKSDIFL